jgi:DNA-binding NtrC family response regulator
MKKVLVIDDDMVSRKLVAGMIDRQGLCAFQSSNGKHAWETLMENTDISLVVTDLCMPDMDGFELVQLIRSNPMVKEIPVILISGVISDSEVSSTLKLGKCHFVKKPVAPKAFKELLTKALEGTTQAEAEV